MFAAGKIVLSIEDEEVTEKTLKHLGFWDVKARPGSKRKASPLARCKLSSPTLLFSSDSVTHK
jgi:hypothetical protein